MNAEEIKKLEERKEMAMYQRKITTQLSTVWEYDREIEEIDRKLEQLRSFIFRTTSLCCLIKK